MSIYKSFKYVLDEFGPEARVLTEEQWKAKDKNEEQLLLDALVHDLADAVADGADSLSETGKIHVVTTSSALLAGCGLAFKVKDDTEESFAVVTIISLTLRLRGGCQHPAILISGPHIQGKGSEATVISLADPDYRDKVSGFVRKISDVIARTE